MPVQNLAERPAMQERLPAELAGWRWLQDVATSQWRLAAPDGWMTKGYADPSRTLAEAKRRVLSAPTAKPIEPALDPQRALAATAAATLRKRGFGVREHGRNWIVREEGTGWESRGDT